MENFKDDTKKLEYHLKNKEKEKTLASGSKVAKANEPNLMEWMKFFYKKPLLKLIQHTCGYLTLIFVVIVAHNNLMCNWEEFVYGQIH